MSETFKVQVIEHSTQKVVHEVVATSLNNAQKIDGGLNINLNHEQYFTSIINQYGEEV